MQATSLPPQICLSVERCVCREPPPPPPEGVSRREGGFGVLLRLLVDVMREGSRQATGKPKKASRLRRMPENLRYGDGEQRMGRSVAGFVRFVQIRGAGALVRGANDSPGAAQMPNAQKDISSGNDSNANAAGDRYPQGRNRVTGSVFSAGKNRATSKSKRAPFVPDLNCDKGQKNPLMTKKRPRPPRAWADSRRRSDVGAGRTRPGATASGGGLVPSLKSQSRPEGRAAAKGTKT